jgi:peptide deformylase
MALTLIQYHPLNECWTLDDLRTGIHWDLLPAKPVDFETLDWNWYHDFMDELVGCMYGNRVPSLSAPQVGVDLQILMYDTGNPDRYDRPRDEIQTNGEGHLLNPKIMAYSDRMVTAYERCASMPDYLFLVERPAEVVVSGYCKSTCGLYQTSIHAGGYLARVLQHEMEHMAGHVFTRLATAVMGTT